MAGKAERYKFDGRGSASGKNGLRLTAETQRAQRVGLGEAFHRKKFGIGIGDCKGGAKFESDIKTALEGHACRALEFIEVFRVGE